MHFTTLQFAVFFLIVLIVNWYLRTRGRAYRIFLLAANLVFYGSFNLSYVPLLLTVGLSNWAFAYGITRADRASRRKQLLILDLVLNLGLLAFFKYFEFFYRSFESLALIDLSEALVLTEIIFPIGISFFTFQGISYTIDVYRDPEQLVTNPLDILVFVSFFPTVLSGPIMRARKLIPQFDRPWFDPRGFQVGLALILSGLFKKVVIASYLSEHIVRQVFQVPSNYSSWTVLAAVYGYSIQIFCDFAGYSELAIGFALLMGFQIPDNFRNPYLAVNPREFWHRWHISLSNWLRDYLYIPLGGNRTSRPRRHFNLLTTMVLGGLWHGAHVRYILWGTLHGLGLMFSHLWHEWTVSYQKKRTTHIYGDLARMREVPDNRPAPRPKPAPEDQSPALRFLGWFLTFHFVSFLWVFFRAENADRAFEIFRAVFDIGRSGGGFELLVIPALAAGLLVQIFGRHLFDFYLKIQSRLPSPLQGLLVALLCIIIIKMGPEGVLPFIYFQF